MRTRMLSQFADAPVFQAFLEALAVELQVLIDAVMASQQIKTPAEALGAQIEVIGRIVGIERMVFDYGRLDWFTPDTTEYPPDLSLAWVTGSPIGTLAPVDDGTFRNLIEFKVARNFTQYGSIPEIQAAILKAFGTDVSFIPDADPMDFTLVLPETTPPYVINFLTTAYENIQAESIYFPPYPMTWRITNNVTRESLGLTPSNGAILTSASQEFQWGDVNASEYRLWVGTTLGGYDLYGGFPEYSGNIVIWPGVVTVNGISQPASGSTDRSVTIAGLPTDGRVVYARLWCRGGNGWIYKDYEYTSVSDGTAWLTFPHNGMTLDNFTLNFLFTWTNSQADGYELWVGSSSGAADLGVRPPGGTTGTSIMVADLPTDGRDLFIRLRTLHSGVWTYNDYTFVAPTR